MIIPSFLNKGDKIAIIATARAVDRELVEYAIDIINSWGLKVITGNHLYERNFRFGGTDDQRIADLQWAISNTEIKAVFCVRGGYGTTRIIDNIDLKPLFKHPKWILGFSDVTTLLLGLERIGVASIHSPMPALFKSKTDSKAVNSVKDFLMTKTDYVISWKTTSLCSDANCTGSLVGGNLSMIANNIGTETFPLSFKNKVLFIEEVGEDLYKIDRYMVQLKRAGVLRELSGLIVGSITDIPYDEEPFGLEVNEIIESHIKEYNYPVYYGAPFGHCMENYPVPVGMQADISVENGKTFLSIRK
ncbi:S66 peptidase family protein [Marinigracilibium pacificum]|uniref:LD-carboxypeptidase n=1 Tax=Marinigracilibium pacificum TaxID=2729599 RepID=A0A848J5Z2_9BACT|nr:LD-carboxypeptidase [Marinigracilibium pacificum]NMM49789.1 LD-carboxypeptidase [Marinigracilibium pacificum]